MKAFAVLLACLVIAGPAQALGHAGGPHVVAGRGGHHGHGGFGPGLWGGGLAVVPDVAAPVDEAPPVLEPVAEPFPVPFCPRFAPPRPKPGPHIIYIGQRPTIHGPKVIYGTE